jgi:hypothetical protein
MSRKRCRYLVAQCAVLCAANTLNIVNTRDAANSVF